MGHKHAYCWRGSIRYCDQMVCNLIFNCDKRRRQHSPSPNIPKEHFPKYPVPDPPYPPPPNAMPPEPPTVVQLRCSTPHHCLWTIHQIMPTEMSKKENGDANHIVESSISRSDVVAFVFSLLLLLMLLSSSLCRWWHQHGGLD